MKSVKVLFLHGLEGTPEGSKPKFLRRNGIKVIAPSLPKDNWGLSVQRAMDCFENFEPDFVVGSSRGGAIAAAIPTAEVPKILIAPAWKKFTVTDPMVDTTTTILHCEDDDLVSFADSVDLKRDYGCELIECGLNHRMSDKEALENLLSVIVD